jgi:hypothetical protein
MNTAILRAEDHFPQEVPKFQPPLPTVMAHLEGKLDNVAEVSEAYFREREALVAFWEVDADALEEIVSRFSLTGGDPRLEDLIYQAGEHLEKVRAEVLPRIEETLKLRRDAAALRIPHAKALMTSIIDRNLSLMRRYVKAIEEIYNRLIGLRDRSIQQSVAGLSAIAWSGVWDDEE